MDTMIRRFSVLWLAACCALALTACGGDSDSGSAGGAGDAASGEQAAAQPERGNISGTGSDERRLYMVRELEASVDLPDLYPADAPAYPGTKPSTTQEMADGSISVQFGVDDSVPRVIEWLRDHMDEQGWELQSEHEMPTGVAMLARKGDRDLKVLVTTVGTTEEHVTMLGVVVTPES